MAYQKVMGLNLRLVGLEPDPIMTIFSCDSIIDEWCDIIWVLIDILRCNGKKERYVYLKS